MIKVCVAALEVVALASCVGNEERKVVWEEEFECGVL